MLQSKLIRTVSGFVVCCAVSGMLRAGDWPMWRGPLRDDISTETGLLQEWPEGGPQKLWTSTEGGLGYSGFSVVGDTLFTMGAFDDTEFLIALNTTDGSVKWKTPVGPLLTNGWGDGPRSTPAVADGRVVALGGEGTVLCADAESGKELWSAELKGVGGSVPNWGYSESPLIDGDRVLVTPGGDQGTVLCLALSDGATVWQSSDITEGAHYSSVIVVEHFGKKQYIQLTMSKVFGLDENGKLLWQADWPGRIAVIPTPIYRDGLVYVTSGYGVGSMLLRISEDNQVEKIYDTKVMQNHHGGVVLLDGHVYGNCNGRGWMCQDLMTGEMVWNEKDDLGKGAVAYADGRLYCLDERTGDCVLALPSTEGWKEAGRFTLEPQTTRRNPKGRIWTHPVICNGKLYLRDQEIICCYDIKS